MWNFNQPETLVNLALCIVIFILAYWGYRIRHDLIPFLVGVAFALFGISHFFKILALGDATVDTVLIGVRVLGYLLVVAALYLRLRRGSPTAKS